tara:strand:+ start:1505 stop:2119 length:615 start_codon:yes stop_codon:yes gene_type:complete
MSGLTKSQIEFLKTQGISEKMTFNAKGLKKSEYKNLMKPKGKIIAYNVSPCRKEGHTLRTRSGHCAQCDTAAIGFQKRSNKVGFTYIAGTQKGKLIKIGFTEIGVELREISLNKSKYGEFEDWKILFAVNCINALEVENKTQSELKENSVSITYNHDNKKQKTDELFKCSYSKSKNILINISEEEKYNSTITINKIGKNYEFEY